MRSRTRLALVFSGTLLGTACEAPPTAPADFQQNAGFARSESAPVHQVTGGGKLDISLFDPNLPPETYAFSASVDGSGDVRGQMQIRFSDVALTLHAQITCLAVNGTSAWIGGAVTRTSDENMFPLGGEFWFRIQDNGEGSADPPDLMSFIRLGAPASICSQQRPVGMPFEWLHGNVRVR